VTLVLLIDDEPSMTDLISMWLDDVGARVTRAASLQEAVNAAQREPPDIVLLDFGLGNEDGLNILPRLREEPSLASVPVIAFTVHSSREHEALEAGVAGFVAKPFEAAGLREVLQPYLR
jgi:CheY-like chemotaxis protein